MGWEIERRYLVRVEPGVFDRLDDSMDLRQGYVRNGEPASVRIRTGEPRGPVLTCKSGRGVRRKEVEAVVPEDLAEVLFLAAENRIVEKTRFLVEGWELDRFGGALEGLILMERELDDPDDPVPEPPDGVEILHEVTDDNRFTSGHLARMSKKDQRRFPKKVYEEFGG